jgi:hypothetical protein
VTGTASAQQASFGEDILLLPVSWRAIARCHLEKESLLLETELLWGCENKE